jgi:hypothetical protein
VLTNANTTTTQTSWYELSKSCKHSFCVECLHAYLKLEKIESRTDIACDLQIHPNDIYDLIIISSNSSNLLKKNRLILLFQHCLHCRPHLHPMEEAAAASSTSSSSSPSSIKSTSNTLLF